MFMSLVSFTFGNNATDVHNNPHLWIETPADRAVKNFGPLECEARVDKVCKFFGGEGIYAIVKVSSGCITSGLRAELGEKVCIVTDVESRYGNAAKEGMSCGITLSGIDVGDIKAGETIKFA
jgi:hypothetical protein